MWGEIFGGFYAEGMRSAFSGLFTESDVGLSLGLLYGPG
jgi:hypothetical protein